MHARPLAGFRAGRRMGFTLIELIVVVSIMLALMAIAAAMLPGVMEREKAAQGAGQVQGWLMIARGRALRDQAPRGLRLNLSVDLLTTTNKLFVTDLQYIEQPEDLGGNTGWSISSISGNQVSFAPTNANSSAVDFTAGNTIDKSNPDNVANWMVQPGDYLEIKGGGTMYLITDVTNKTANKAGPGDILVLAANPVAVSTSPPIWQYRIVRQPRILAGEDTLQLPRNVAIDMQSSMGVNGGTMVQLGGGLFSAANPAFDILFDRFGNVVGQAAINDKILLWVRDVSLGDQEGDQTLLSIGSRSGLIESHAVNFDPDLGGFYIFTQDGRSTGT